MSAIPQLPFEEYRVLLRNDLMSFIERSFYELNPQANFQAGRYIELVAAALEPGLFSEIVVREGMHSLSYLLEVFPLTDVIRKVLSGSGECARINWRLLGLSMPGWVLIAAAGLHLFLHRTDFGKAIRATAQDSTTARLMGINIERIYMVTFAIGAALVGLAGCLLTPVYYVFPSVGTDFVLVAFVVVVLGGLGSLAGAVVGGLLIGVVEQLSGFFIDTSLRQIVYFALFIGVLVVRPAGLFGQRGAEEFGLK